jgi:hypothetical protein
MSHFQMAEEIKRNGTGLLADKQQQWGFLETWQKRSNAKKMNRKKL